MSLALESVCGKFGMELTDEPATRVVAQKIIELAQRSVRDAPTLTEMTLQELKHYLPYAEDRAARDLPGQARHRKPPRPSAIYPLAASSRRKGP
jgi:hypothetical protein